MIFSNCDQSRPFNGLLGPRLLANPGNATSFGQTTDGTHTSSFNFTVKSDEQNSCNVANKASTTTATEFGSNISNAPRFTFGSIQSGNTNIASSTPVSAVQEPVSSNALWANEIKSQRNTHFRLSCHKSILSLEMFRCPTCNSFHHADCISMVARFGFLDSPSMFPPKYRNCSVCDPPSRSASPQLSDSFQPNAVVPPVESPAEIEDAMPTIRRSLRDETKISLCSKPDQVDIIAEHFANPTGFSAFWAFDSELPESDNIEVEPLFDINDSVLPLILPSTHPDRKNPYRITFRYFNGPLDSTDASDDDDDVLDDIESDNIDEINDIENNDHMTDIDTDTTTDETEQDSIDSLFGKKGWSYRLDRCPGADAIIKPDAIWWHEDNLRLELGDEDEDEDGEQEETRTEIVTSDSENVPVGIEDMDQVDSTKQNHTCLENMPEKKLPWETR